MKFTVIDLEGTKHELEADEGDRLMEIIRYAGLPIKAECGGCCACATCHVYVAESWIPKIEPANEEEEDMLDLAFEIKDNSRLSCQLIMSPALDGIEITLAPGSV